MIAERNVDQDLWRHIASVVHNELLFGNRQVCGFMFIYQNHGLNENAPHKQMLPTGSANYNKIFTNFENSVSIYGLQQMSLELIDWLFKSDCYIIIVEI